jgi:hypothetical protein
MVKVYTDVWNGFQFRAPAYLDGHHEPHKFDLVKWEDHEPYEVTDWVTGEKRMSTRSCFSIATLTWDSKEQGFDFESVGLRYLEHRVDGLEKFIFNFCEMMIKELKEDD